MLQHTLLDFTVKIGYLFPFNILENGHLYAEISRVCITFRTLHAALCAWTISPRFIIVASRSVIGRCRIILITVFAFNFGNSLWMAANFWLKRQFVLRFLKLFLLSVQVGPVSQFMLALLIMPLHSRGQLGLSQLFLNRHQILVNPKCSIWLITASWTPRIGRSFQIVLGLTSQSEIIRVLVILGTLVSWSENVSSSNLLALFFTVKRLLTCLIGANTEQRVLLINRITKRVNLSIQPVIFWVLTILGSTCVPTLYPLSIFSLDPFR